MLAIANESSNRRITTSRGVMNATHVGLATNRYTDASTPWHRRRVMPISSTIIATEALGVDRVRSLLPAGCPVIDSKRVICFARPSPDHRHVLFGGRARFSPIGPVESARILREQMIRMFPALEDVKLTHVWSGYMAFTFDFLPKFGVHDGIHYALGCNGGCGIVMMSWLGRALARQMTGHANRDSAFAGLAFKAPPLYSGRPWFLPVVGNWYRLRDWLELRTARAAR